MAVGQPPSAPVSAAMRCGRIKVIGSREAGRYVAASMNADGDAGTCMNKEDAIMVRFMPSTFPHAIEVLVRPFWFPLRHRIHEYDHRTLKMALCVGSVPNKPRIGPLGRVGAGEDSFQSLSVEHLTDHGSGTYLVMMTGPERENQVTSRSNFSCPAYREIWSICTEDGTMSVSCPGFDGTLQDVAQHGSILTLERQVEPLNSAK